MGIMKFTLVSRLKAIWRILTKNNFILIEVSEFVNENGEAGRDVRVLLRTDYTIDSDVLTLEAAKRITAKNEQNKRT